MKRTLMLGVAAVLSSLCFLAGSILFLPRFVDYSVFGVWLFALGSALMLLTTADQLRCSLMDARKPSQT